MDVSHLDDEPLDGSPGEFSAGGVMVRGRDVVVIVPTRRGAGGEVLLCLPKGHPEEGETLEQAATREVREETGVSGELVDSLGDVRYWYQRKGRRILKSVTFFLFDYKVGDFADHDHEVEQVRWMALDEALTALSHPGEREMVGRALTRIDLDR